MGEFLNVLTDYGDNACCVDWSQWSNCSYDDAAKVYVYRVGDFLAQVIELLRKDYTSMVVNLMFGHSLGAHVVGECGRLVQDPQLPWCIGKL